jgi:hypothetical protein
MNAEQRLAAMRDTIQCDVGKRGLARDPKDNLLTACPGDLAAACRSVAATGHAHVAIVTGFHIAAAEPPCHETDGPLGALFLARALATFGIGVHLLADGTSVPALRAALGECGLAERVPVCELSLAPAVTDLGRATHLLAVERVGPGHTLDSLRGRPSTTDRDLAEFESLVPPDQRGRCRSMRGLDVSRFTRPVDQLFEARPPGLMTLGIGDGGNEIGMAKIPWRTIRNNIPNGGLIACRVPTDYLIVAGVSNWGAYALACGVALLRGRRLPDELFDVERERELLGVMVEQGPLVDGVTGKQTVTVDGLSFEQYARVLEELGRMR